MEKTRSLANLMQSARAFQESRVLLTALELDVFTTVGEGATAATVSQRLGTDPRATEMLLNALVAVGALGKGDAVFRCTGESKALGPARPGLLHMVHLWDTWSSLTECVKSGSAVRSRGPASFPEARTRAFIAAMHARARDSAQETVRLSGIREAKHMLDVGGGSGAFSIAFAKACPDLRAEILDLGAVVPLAEEYIRAAGLQDRVRVRPGDMRTAEFGEGFDLVLLSAVCHMFSEDENRSLIQRCARALLPGGHLVIREFILQEDRTAPLHAALFALNMLVGTERGNTYTEGQYRAWMQEAGLGTIARPDPEGDVLVASKPG
jgi:ubiquinone/menaquinone biosynthesis C-methylase UbiE/DNA-binding CsgD family transcriptional regulator